MMSLHTFCESVGLSQQRGRKLASQARIGYWNIEQRVFVPACVKVGPRAWIIDCDNPTIRPPDREMRKLTDLQSDT